MNLYFRFIWLILRRLIISNPIDVFSRCTSKFWVNILDLDFNLHMNNGRYFSVMDLGRFDLMLRSKTFWPLLKKGCFPVVSSQTIRFKKSLTPFQSYELVTQIEAWDEKDFYMKQQFIKNDFIYAEGFIKGRFLQHGRKGSLPTREVFKMLGLEYGDGKMSDLAEQQKTIESMLVRQEN